MLVRLGISEQSTGLAYVGFGEHGARGLGDFQRHKRVEIICRSVIAR